MAMSGYPLTADEASCGNWLLWLAGFAGLVLSVMELLEFCTDACTETARFSIFGLGFGWFGVFFFGSALALLAARHRYQKAEPPLVLLMFAAAGAEFRFIWLQKYVIGSWCPVCLAIAVTVYIGIAVLMYQILRRKTSMGSTLKWIAVFIIAIAVGATSATYGVAEEKPGGIDFFLGNAKSPVTVYFISDWFCPVCLKVEPRLEQIYNRVRTDARVAFIDYPIHAETNNFTPYNLQFIAFEKEKYPKLRAALAALARKTGTPTPDQVQAAVTPLGVTLRQMNYADILNGLQSNFTSYRGFGVTATPAVVVQNARTKKHQVLVGDKQITLPAVEAAVAEVGR